MSVSLLTCCFALIRSVCFEVKTMFGNYSQVGFFLKTHFVCIKDCSETLRLAWVSWMSSNSGMLTIERDLRGRGGVDVLQGPN